MNVSPQTILNLHSNDASSNHPSTPSLLESLQERAHAGFQATAQIVKEQVDLAKQAAHDRVQIAKAGKKLLDEGGESTAQLVVAKNASIAASDIDRSIASRVQVGLVHLENSVAKLRMAQSNTNFSQLADEHEARAATCRRISHMLEMPASCADMSPEERDALAIVKAREMRASVMSRTSDGLENMRQKTLASVTSAGTTQGDAIAHSSRISEPTSEATQASTLLEGLQEKARAGLEQVREVAKSRLETATAGKRLLDDGGDSVAQVVVAKKACLDAADLDRDVAQRVQSAIAMFDDSAAKLRAVPLRQETLVALGCGNLTQLAEEHETRANTYRQIAAMLVAPISSEEMTPVEWDALSLVKVKDGCGALQCRTNEGFEVIKSMAFASCSSEVDREGQRRRTVCA